MPTADWYRRKAEESVSLAKTAIINEERARHYARPIGCSLLSREASMDDMPSSAQQPWWLGKAQRQHILLKFIVICVIVALLFVGTIALLHG